MRGLLNAVFDWTSFFIKSTYGKDVDLKTIMDNQNDARYSGAWAISNALNWVTNGVLILFGLVGLAGVIYSIYLGIQLARAEDQSKRDDAKKHLTTVIIALGVTLLLVVFFLHLLPAIISAFKAIG